MNLTVLADWFESRDYFLGLTLPFDMDRGLCLAKKVAKKHKDAEWLVALFPSGAPKNIEEAVTIFEEFPDDGRAICFGELLKKNTPRFLLLGDDFIDVASTGAWQTKLASAASAKQNPYFLGQKKKA